ncbi:MAG: hypothetical protein LBS91_08920 [Clostridiales Family XIII bacterium]|jgi:hypothetical protein|nr:hypothetical protein [Clostridiales Family XIII bacterium]
MEAVNAYYDGNYFVPTTRPKSLKKNQKAIVTILDDTAAPPNATTSALLQSLQGKYPELSSKDFAARKQAEKDLDL